MKSYTGTVSFAGFIGADETYTTIADSIEDAEEQILEQAKEDLIVEEVEEIDDGEYEVTVNFCTFVGVDEIYKVYADDEDEAADAGLEEASFDLSVEFEDDVEDDDIY